MFDTTKKDLKDLLREADEGRLQLPDFQRDYVWSDEDVRSLIASVAKGYPVGALLTLSTGGDLKFKPRQIAGVPERGAEPDELLLDGQQRITSLYQAAYSDRPVATKTHRGTVVERYYYLDIHQAIKSEANFDDAIVGVPANRILKSDFGRKIELDVSSREKEFEKHLFPLARVFDSKGWFYDWRDHWKAQGKDVADLMAEFDRGVIDRIERYEMPLIRLNRTIGREAICFVFEKVNVGGMKLDAFELLTAIYASSEFDLRSDWYGCQDGSKIGRKGQIIGSYNPRDVLKQVASTDFLQSCTLLHTRQRRLSRVEEGHEGRELPQISCNRDSLLKLPLDGYQAHADKVQAGMIEAAAFLNEHKIFRHRDVPYPPLIVGLASIFAILDQRELNSPARQEISKWFWSVTLGELFRSSTETRLARDIPELVNWIRNADPRPQAFDEAVFQQDRLRTLRSRNSAAYKGINALLMQHCCKDFITDRPAEISTFFNDQIDIHHIFPQAWCKKNGFVAADFNSIVNKTPLSRRSNISIGGDAPSKYLEKIEKETGMSSDALDVILDSHLIDPIHLRTDDFEAFYRARMLRMSELITNAMDKPVICDSGSDEIEQDDNFAVEDVFDLRAAE